MHLQRQCPLCKHLSQILFFPFCSKRCQMIDLGKWFKEDYVIDSKFDLQTNAGNHDAQNDD